MRPFAFANVVAAAMCAGSTICWSCEHDLEQSAVTKIRQSIYFEGYSTSSVVVDGLLTRITNVPECIRNSFDAHPLETMRLLARIVDGAAPNASQKTYVYAAVLMDDDPRRGAVLPGGAPPEYDEPLRKGGKTLRQFNVDEINKWIDEHI